MRLPHTLWILFVIGVLLRVAAIEMRPAGAMLVAPDEPEYLEIARNIAAGNGFALHGQPTAYRDMLFPSWAAAKGLVIGIPHGVLYAQLVADLLTALMLFLLIRRRISERAAVLGAGIWLLYPAAILFTAMFLTETLFVFLWVLALWIFDRLDSPPFTGGAKGGPPYEGRAGRVWIKGILLGLVLGLLLLARSTGVILLAAILPILIYRRRFLPAIVVLAVAFLTVLPWMLRNERVMHTFTLNTNSGINLFIGNNPNATGAYRFDDPVVTPLDSFAGVNEISRNRVATHLALNYWRSRPMASLALWPKKFAYLWSTDMSLWAHYQPRPELSLREQLRAAPVALLAITGLLCMLLAAGGIAGVVLIKETPLRSLLLLQLGIATLAAFATYGLARYHFPLMPAMVIGAASLTAYPNAWRNASRSRRIAAGLIIACFAVIWLTEIWTIAGS